MSIGNYFIWPKTCCFWTRTGLRGMLNHFHLKECLSEKSEPGQPNEIFSQKFWPNRLFWGKIVTVLAGCQWVNISYDLKLVVFELEMVLCMYWTIFTWKNVYQKNLSLVNLTRFILSKTEIFGQNTRKVNRLELNGKIFQIYLKTVISRFPELFDHLEKVLE